MSPTFENSNSSQILPKYLVKRLRIHDLKISSGIHDSNVVENLTIMTNIDAGVTPRLLRSIPWYGQRL